MAPGFGGHKISDVAVLNRMRSSPAFLRALISSVLARRLQAVAPAPMSVCLIDGTTVRRPGGQGADWRLHLSYDLQRQQLLEVELTSAAEGETLTRLDVNPDRVYIADRGYGTTPGIVHLLTAGARFVVRVTPQNVRLRSIDGKPLKIVDWLQGLADATPAERLVGVAGEPTQLRLIAIRKSPGAAQRARRLAVREGRRNGGTVRADTLTLADYILVLTNCPEYTPAQVLETYGFRWQIELAFKRLKTIMQFDHLRAHDPEVAQAYLLAKILAALVVEELNVRAVVFFPWGYELKAQAS
jgi:hypothetical protein